MRTIKSVVLRLYFDSEVPNRLCGDLQAQPERKTFYFQNEGELVQILRQLSPDINGEQLLNLPRAKTPANK